MAHLVVAHLKAIFWFRPVAEAVLQTSAVEVVAVDSERLLELAVVAHLLNQNLLLFLELHTQ